MADKVKAPTIDEMMKWEAGMMLATEKIDFFQRLIDSGKAWALPPEFGRQAQRMIDAGICTPEGKE